MLYVEEKLILPILKARKSKVKVWSFEWDHLLASGWGGRYGPVQQWGEEKREGGRIIPSFSKESHLFVGVFTIQTPLKGPFSWHHHNRI